MYKGELFQRNLLPQCVRKALNRHEKAVQISERKMLQAVHDRKISKRESERLVGQQEEIKVSHVLAIDSIVGEFCDF